MTDKVGELTVLDAGVLIALALDESSATGLSQKIISHPGLFACTEIGLCELSYILCRRLSWGKTWKKTQSLIESSAVTIIPTHILWTEAARIKCNSSIALPDCFTIAAARLTKGRAMFARREKELVDAVKRKQITDAIEYLE
ncbi:MAG: PIN domain-containing protein [Candidatus Thorarchaeota archaeon]